jgi:hypothetical protein
MNCSLMQCEKRFDLRDPSASKTQVSSTETCAARHQKRLHWNRHRRPPPAPIHYPASHAFPPLHAPPRAGPLQYSEISDPERQIRPVAAVIWSRPHHSPSFSPPPTPCAFEKASSSSAVVLMGLGPAAVVSQTGRGTGPEGGRRGGRRRCRHGDGAPPCGRAVRLAAAEGACGGVPSRRAPGS